MSRECRQDARVLRTKAQLRTALLALCEEQELPTITVKDVTNRAAINRNTFYRHYVNKDALVAETLDSLFESLTAPSRQYLVAHGQLTPDAAPPPTVELFRELGRHPELYARLLGKMGSPDFVARLRTFYEGQFIGLWNDLGMVAEAGSPPVDLRAAFAASSMESIVRWWLIQGHAVPADQAAAWVWQLLSELWFPWQTRASAAPRPYDDSQSANQT